MFDKWSRLERLNGLRQSGALSEEEFLAQKSVLMAPRSPIDKKPALFGGALLLVVVGIIAAVRVADSTGSYAREDLANAAATATDAAATAADAAADATAAPSRPPQKFSADELATAFALRYAGKATEAQFGGEQVTYLPKRLVFVEGQTLALVSEGTWGSGACHACSGTLRIDYVLWSGGGFFLPSTPVQFTQGGQGWGEPPRWKVVAGDGLPVIKVTSAYDAQGCINNKTTELKLTPAGVVEVASKDAQDCSEATAAAAAVVAETPSYAKPMQ